MCLVFGYMKKNKKVKKAKIIFKVKINNLEDIKKVFQQNYGK